MYATNPDDREHPVVHYDGDCVLCGRAVMFIIKNDPDKIFRFSSLRSNPLKLDLKDLGKDVYGIKSIILEENGKRYLRTDAILRIFWILGGLFRITVVFRLVPSSLRDSVYDWIARNRYQWFGHEKNYLKPGPEIRDRFLDASRINK